MKKLLAWLIFAATALLPQVAKAAKAESIEFNLGSAYQTAQSGNKILEGYYYNYDPENENKGRFTIQENTGLLPQIGAPRTLSRVFTASNGHKYRLVLDFKNRDQYPQNISVAQNTYSSGTIPISFKDNIEFDVYILNSHGKRAATLTFVYFYPIGSYTSDQAKNIKSSPGSMYYTTNSSNSYARWSGASDIANFAIGNNEILYAGDTRVSLGNIIVHYNLLPTEPEAPVLSAVSGKKPDSDGVINFVNSIDIQASVNEADEDQKIELYGEMAEPGSTKRQPDVTAANKLTNNQILTIARNCRYMLMAKNPAGTDLTSPVTELTFNRLEAKNFESIGALTGITAGQAPPTSSSNDREVVTFSRPMLVEGIYATNQNNITFIYLRDTNGDMIRAVCASNAMPAGVKAGEYLPANGIAGRYIHNAGMPEIEISDFTKYCSPTAATTDNPETFPATEARDNSGLGQGERIAYDSDFNKHLVLSHVTYTENNRVADANGNSYQLYPRFQGYDVESHEAGTPVNLDCYVGKTAEGIMLIPVKTMVCAPAPDVRFKNGNRISGEVHIVKVDAQHPIEWELIKPEDGDSYSYLCNLDGVNWMNAPQPVDISDFKGTLPDGRKYCDLTVAANIGADYDPMTSTVEKIRFIKVEATERASIREFKDALLDDEGNVKINAKMGDYYLIGGNVVIEAKTDYYLYVRDNIENAGSRSHLLIYNPNKWDNPQIVDASGRSRSLAEGDVISGFVMKPDLTPQGNLRGRGEGFARTYGVVANPGTVQPATMTEVEVCQCEAQPGEAPHESYYKNFTYTGADRMMHFRFKNVTVDSRPNPAYADAEELEDGTRVDENGEIVDELIYTLELGTPLDIRFNVFTSRRGGWVTSYNAGVQYTIEGVLVQDKQRSPSGFSLAMMDFSAADQALAPAKIYMEGLEDAAPDENGEISYISAGKVFITKAEGARENAVIYYTLDGSDPKTNRHRRVYDAAQGIELPDNMKVVSVRAYAAWPGASPSAEMSMKFRRESEEFTYILNFLSQAQEGMPYHFNGHARVVAIGGEYMFVRGTQGHYLALHRPGGDWRSYAQGQYVSDMIVEVEKVGADKIVRGATISDAHARFLTPGSAAKPAGLRDEIAVTQREIADQIDEVSAANARRLVTVRNVALEGVEFEAEASSLATEWTLIPNQGHDIAKAVRINHSVLAFEMPEKGTAGKYYNVTGFVMLDEKGTPEIWPTAIDRIENATAPAVSADDDAVLTQAGVNAYVLEFYPSAVVSLSYSGKNASKATIRYIFTDDESAPVDNARWNVYGQPFSVSGDGYIHAYVEVPGMEASGHTHIELVRTQKHISGGVTYTMVKDGEGAAKVALKPVDDLAAGSYAIYYSTDYNTAPSVSDAMRYTAPFAVPQSGVVLAILVEEGKRPGEVQTLNVWYFGEQTGIDDIEGSGAEGVRVEGDSIIAPQGSEVYDLSGRRVQPTGLAGGVYIVRLPGGKAVKVRV